jgi:hypothetical protein
MRKLVLIAILCGLASLIAPEGARAQSFYSVKFVCGVQSPQPANPNLRPGFGQEPDVKPGNYATAINVEILSTVPAGTPQTSWTASIIESDQLTSPGGILLSPQQFQSQEINCSSIQGAAQASNLVITPFASGYVNIFTNPGEALKVTAVYTSQGCAFRPSNARVAPTCSGPVSIDVVQQSLGSAP